jgi:hypothetical protein
VSRCKRSILLYGDSGDGKSAQLGELAKHLYKTTGKKTLVYSGDGGGYLTIQPLINLGVIQIVDCTTWERPFEWLNKIVQGMIPNPSGAGWVSALTDEIGGVDYEGLTGSGELLMQDLAEQTAKGANIGGGPNISFTQGEVKVGGNNMAHFGVVQSRLSAAVAQSQRLPVDYVCWTALARRGQDQDTMATILGPQAVGKALTSEIPRWFQLCFRLMAVPANPVLKTKAEHRLYLRDHNDPTAAGAKSLGNDRVPMGATPLPEFISPASVVEALALVDKAVIEAEAKLREELLAAGQSVIDSTAEVRQPTAPAVLTRGVRPQGVR